MKDSTIVERKSDLEIVVRRTFDAPARIVFEAWANPDLFRRWWVPKSIGMSLVSFEADIRTGGSYRLVFSYQGSQMAFFGTYLEVTPHSKLVWSNDEGAEGPAITTVTFEEKAGKTFVVMSELHPSKEACENGLGAAQALSEQFGQLDELLGTL